MPYGKFGKNLSQNKMILTKNRTYISDEIWSKYLEKNYPEWWEKTYKNKWTINIIYYFNDTHIVIPLLVNKNSTMMEIMKIWKQYLNNQYRSIDMCFGSDISPVIKKHMVTDFKIDSNYLYVHKRIQNLDGTISFKRYNVSNEKKLIHLCGELCDQNTNNLNLRLRSIPLRISGSNFTTKIDY
jgi:hypothetical protein